MNTKHNSVQEASENIDDLSKETDDRLILGHIFEQLGKGSRALAENAPFCKLIEDYMKLFQEYHES